MSTPAEKFDVAVDGTENADARLDAIDELHTANECERLVEILQNDDLDERYRERALQGLADSQCKETLERLADSGDVPDAFADEAEELLGERPDHTGASP